MSLHPDVEQAIEQIDAAIFSGDCGGPEGVAKVKEYCERWLRGLASLEEVFELSEAEEKFQELAGDLQTRLAIADLEEDDDNICPMCGENEVEYDDQHGVCSECNTCPECGTNQISEGHICDECKNKPKPKCGNDGTKWQRLDCEYDACGVCIHCKEEIPF